MTISKENQEKIATILDGAQQKALEVKRFTLEYEDLTVEEGYEIQAMGIDMRLARGEKVAGYKMGLTSRAKMEQMGVDSPITGVLMESMCVDPGGTLKMGDRIHPKVEPEVAFVLKNELKGDCTREEAAAAVDYVMAAIEVIDSRFENLIFISRMWWRTIVRRLLFVSVVHTSN